MRFVKRVLFSVVLSMVCCTTFSRLEAQTQKGIPTDGRDFYIAYVAPSIKCGAIKPFQAVFAIVSSYYDCSVTLSYFDPAQGGLEVTGTTTHILAKNSANIQLDMNYMDPKDANGNRMNIDGEVPMYTACRIHADHPISVAYYSTGPNSGGMYLAFQTGALGKTYVIAAAPANPALGAANSHHFSCQIDSGSSEFAIIAIKDNTSVTIIPNGLTRTGHVGVNSGNGSDGTPHPFTAKLMRGQVYWVKSTIDEDFGSNDMSGSIVKADQPIAVLGASESMYNGESQYAGYGGDQRDLSVEEMVPVDYWTSDGYVSMPFMDSPGISSDNASAGDQYKIFTYDSTATMVTVNIDKVGTRNIQVSQFQSPPVTYDNIQDGINIGSQNGQKIMVEEYDYRAMNNEPFPAPSQMNIIPLDRFRTSFMWGVPDDKSQVHKKRYINVIARRDQFAKIKVQTNGKAPLPLTSLPSAGQTATIPNHPELQGRRYEIQPGGYYAVGDSAFALYQYGDLGLDPDFDLGDNDDDDYYFSYASTCGQSFGIEGALTPKLSVDTVCNGWRIHVHDDNPLDHGIAEIELLKDGIGVLKRKPGSDSGYVSINCVFNPTNYTVLPGTTDTIADIQVNNPLQDAIAYVWVLNVAGNDTLISLHYTAPKLTFLPDSAAFFNSSVGIDTCTHFTFKNLGKPGELSFNVSGYKWLQGGQGVRLTSTVPPLPYKLGPGDSIQFFVCFNATQPAHIYYDTLLVQTDCPTPIAGIIGTTTVPKINTEDYDFGTVVVGKKKCHAIRVWNPGAAPFQLTRQWVLDNFIDFEFTDTAMLPLTIKQGEGVYLNFCFSPTAEGSDTTYQHWSSDIPEPFTHVIKDVSRLSGRGIKPQLTWDRDIQRIITECDTPRSFTAHLLDSGSALIHVDSVRILGPDQDEWQIVANETGHMPMDNFNIQPEQGDSVLFTFTPNRAKGPGSRKDTVWAFDAVGIYPVFILDATVVQADMTVSTNSIDFGTILPNGTTSQQSVTVKNPGTAPLIIESLSIDPPFFIVQPGSIKKWDTIQPGKSATIIVQATLTAEGLTKGNLTLKGMTNCPPQGIIQLMGNTSNVSVEGFGHNYPPTYICMNNVNSVPLVSTGTRDVEVLSVQIVDDPAYPGRSDQFQFADGTRLLNLNRALLRNDTNRFDIVYVPTLAHPINQAVGAQVIFTVDTVGDVLPNHGGKWTITKVITGMGLREHQTVSVQNPSTGPYIAKTANTFTVPIRATENVTPLADVHSISLDLTYKQDLFMAGNPSAPAVAAPGTQIVSQSVTDVGGIETLHLTVAPQGKQSFDGATTLANITFQLMVARDTLSDFLLSNVVLKNSTGGDICYVLHDSIPGTFVPQELCSNEILRNFLKTGHLIFGIGGIHPNPAAGSVKVDLDFQKDGVPMTMELFNMLGQSVRTYSQAMPMPAGSRTIDLDVSGLPAGTYSLRVTTPEQTESKKLLIQK